MSDTQRIMPGRFAWGTLDKPSTTLHAMARALPFIPDGPNLECVPVTVVGAADYAQLVEDKTSLRKALFDVCGRYERAMEEIDRLANNGALNLAESPSLEDLLEEWRRES